MLQIETKPALLGVNYKLPQIGLDFQRPQSNVTIKDPQLNIRAEGATLKIDQTRCFEEIGLYEANALSRKVSAESKKKVLQGIKKMAIEGNTLARIEKNPKAIASIAKSNFDKTKNYTVGMIPKTPPEINIQGGELRVDLQEGFVNLQIQEWSTTVSAPIEPVNIYLQQKPEINIQYLGNQVDLVK